MEITYYELSHYFQAVAMRFNQSGDKTRVNAFWQTAATVYKPIRERLGLPDDPHSRIPWATVLNDSEMAILSALAAGIASEFGEEIPLKQSVPVVVVARMTAKLVRVAKTKGGAVEQRANQLTDALDVEVKKSVSGGLRSTEEHEVFPDHLVKHFAEMVDELHGLGVHLGA